MKRIAIFLSLFVSFYPLFAEELPQNKISRIDLVVNSLEAGHLEKTLGQLIRICADKKIKIGAVFQIGNLNNLSKTEQMELRRLGGEIVSISAPPEIYPVTSSPAWVFITPQGANIVEGTNNIDRFVSSSGTFVSPDDPAFAESLPTPKQEPGAFNVEGF